MEPEKEKRKPLVYPIRDAVCKACKARYGKEIEAYLYKFRGKNLFYMRCPRCRRRTEEAYKKPGDAILAFCRDLCVDDVDLTKPLVTTTFENGGKK